MGFKQLYNLNVAILSWFCHDFGLNVKGWVYRFKTDNSKKVSVQCVRTLLCARALRRVDSLGQLLLGVGAELQQSHEYRRHVHVGLPHSEASANQIDGGAADGAVGGQLGAGGLQQQEGQCLTCGTAGKEKDQSRGEESRARGWWREEDQTLGSFLLSRLRTKRKDEMEEVLPHLLRVWCSVE